MIIQTLMLIETNQEQEFVSFRTKDINTFIIEHSEDIASDKIKLLENAMNKFD